MKYYIYTLEYKRKIFYVGKTLDIKKRYSKHVSESIKKRTHKEKYIYSILNRGENFDITILDEVDCGLENEMEVYWISQLRTWGFNLLNYNKGGEGGDNWSGRKHTQDTKDKLSKIMIDRIMKGQKLQSQKGEKNGRSKLTSEQVLELRNLREIGYSYSKLSLKFGISKSSVGDIVKLKKWKHL
jgi:group I intron endonuclease